MSRGIIEVTNFHVFQSVLVLKMSCLWLYISIITENTVLVFRN